MAPGNSLHYMMEKREKLYLQSTYHLLDLVLDTLQNSPHSPLSISFVVLKRKSEVLEWLVIWSNHEVHKTWCCALCPELLVWIYHRWALDSFLMTSALCTAVCLDYSHGDSRWEQGPDMEPQRRTDQDQDQSPIPGVGEPHPEHKMCFGVTVTMSSLEHQEVDGRTRGHLLLH